MVVVVVVASWATRGVLAVVVVVPWALVALVVAVAVARLVLTPTTLPLLGFSCG